MSLTNALIKCPGGEVFHYGYYNESYGHWVPMCGIATSRCEPLHSKDCEQGEKISICLRCLGNQLAEFQIGNNGLVKVGEQDYEILEIGKFKNGAFTVGKQFKQWKASNQGKTDSKAL